MEKVKEIPSTANLPIKALVKAGAKEDKKKIPMKSKILDKVGAKKNITPKKSKLESIEEETIDSKAPEIKEEIIKKLKKNEYIEGIGRRKRSVARVRIYTSSPSQSVDKKGFPINGKMGKDYFISKYREVALAPLKKLRALDKFSLTVKVKGGGITGQAEAVRMGLARALVIFDPAFRKKLKRARHLTRDPREKERKKPGLKKARKAPQWSKR